MYVYLYLREPIQNDNNQVLSNGQGFSLFEVIEENPIVINNEWRLQVSIKRVRNCGSPSLGNKLQYPR